MTNIGGIAGPGDYPVKLFPALGDADQIDGTAHGLDGIINRQHMLVEGQPRFKFGGDGAVAGDFGQACRRAQYDFVEHIADALDLPGQAYRVGALQIAGGDAGQQRPAFINLDPDAGRYHFVMVKPAPENLGRRSGVGGDGLYAPFLDRGDTGGGAGADGQGERVAGGAEQSDNKCDDQGQRRGRQMAAANPVAHPGSLGEPARPVFKKFSKSINMAAMYDSLSVRGALAAALLVVVSGPAWAAPDGWAMNLTVENDLFGSGLDRHYTNGMLFTAFSPKGDIPDFVHDKASWLSPFKTKSDSRWSWGIGQNMFTPEDISVKERQNHTRPYAGWLYGSLGMVNEDGRHLSSVEANFGMVGPASLARQTQTIWHKLISSPRPQGWANQLENEPGLVLSYEYKYRNIKPIDSLFGYGVDLTPHVGGSVGNVYTYGATGVTFRFGNDLPGDYGPPRIRPSLGGSGFFTPNDKFDWYLFVGAEGRAIARNIFLDGNTFSGSQRVNKKYLVGDAQAGIAFMALEKMRMSFSWVYRTREFDHQGDPDVFGAFNLSYAF